MSNFIMIIAVLAAPFFAVFAQRQIDLFRSKHERKLWVFKTLMATRGAKVSIDHVRALNMIDLEFQDNNPLEDQIRTTWKEYLDHLGSMNSLTLEAQEKQFPTWRAKADDYLADLLHIMGKRLGYNFDRVHLRKGIYFPEAHLKEEMDSRLLKRLAVEILAGNRSLPTLTAIEPLNEDVAKFAVEYQGLLLKFLRGESASKCKTKKAANKTLQPTPSRYVATLF